MQELQQEYDEPEHVEEASVDEAPQHETPNEGTEVGGEERPETNDSEARARAQGWRPKEEYRGDPDRWVDADEFNRRGEEELPILRERNKRLAEQVTESTRREQALDAELAQMRRMNEIALIRQREQLAGQFHAAKRQAVELGDTDQFDQIAQQEYQALGQFDNEVREVVQQPQPQAPQQSVYEQPETQQFVERNPWFETNREMHTMAVSVSQAIGNANPNLTLGEVLKQTEARVRTAYPEKFGTPSATNHRPSAPAVEGSGAGRGAATRQSGRGAASLPPEARKQAKAFVEEGLYKSVDEYAKDYFENE